MHIVVNGYGGEQGRHRVFDVKSRKGSGYHI